MLDCYRRVLSNSHWGKLRFNGENGCKEHKIIFKSSPVRDLTRQTIAEAVPFPELHSGQSYQWDFIEDEAMGSTVTSSEVLEKVPPPSKGDRGILGL